MNTKRIDFTMPSNHYKITINWLIGFIEGDSSFNYNPQTKKVIFSIGQKGNKVLLEEILNFLKNSNTSVIFSNLIAISHCGRFNVYEGYPGQFNLNIQNSDLIELGLIPIFDSVQWHSKKYSDYLDFKLIFKIRRSTIKRTSLYIRRCKFC